jgi:predicted metal-binding membrane protein
LSHPERIEINGPLEEPGWPNFVNVKTEDPSARVQLLLREAAPAWAAIAALTALAWIVTLDQVRAMGNGAGTMGMSFVAFVAMWTAMMAAMMFPSMAPVAILWTRSIVHRSCKAVASYRIALFVTGYLLAWAFAGVLAFLGLMLFEQVLIMSGNHAGWLGAAIFLIAGVYQLTSFKDVCLRHCRSPMSLLVHYTSFRGRGIDLRVGFHHGLYCVACCWGLMLILVAVGVMNIPAMVLLTIVIFAEKLLRHGLFIARLIGISFFGAAVVAVMFPSFFPGLKPCCTP